MAGEERYLGAAVGGLHWAPPPLFQVARSSLVERRKEMDRIVFICGEGRFQPNRRGSARKRGRARRVRPISGLYSFDFSGLFPCAYQTAELGVREYEIRFRASIQTSKCSVMFFDGEIQSISTSKRWQTPNCSGCNDVHSPSMILWPLLVTILTFLAVCVRKECNPAN